MQRAFLALLTCSVLFLLAWPARSAQPFSEKQVEISGGLGPLRGTVTLPTGGGDVPIVLILPGSGPVDRDGNSAGGLSTNAYKLLSIALAENGIATLRADKRGVAGSAAATPGESALRFETYVDDVVLWTAFVRQDLHLMNVYLLGHSEGALIGLLAAQREKYRGYISVAGSGFSAGEALRRQLKAQPLPPALHDEALATIEELERGRTVAKVSPELMVLFRPSVQPYLISWFKYDPTREITKLRIPTSIIQGTTDIQVSVEDARRLAAARPDAKLTLVNGMNHILRSSPSDRAANLATYSQPALPLNPDLVPAILDSLR